LGTVVSPTVFQRTWRGVVKDWFPHGTLGLGQTLYYGGLSPIHALRERSGKCFDPPFALRAEQPREIHASSVGPAPETLPLGNKHRTCLKLENVPAGCGPISNNATPWSKCLQVLEKTRKLLAIGAEISDIAPLRVLEAA